jgi:hypothetical protein
VPAVERGEGRAVTGRRRRQECCVVAVMRVHLHQDGVSPRACDIGAATGARGPAPVTEVRPVRRSGYGA